MARPQLAELLRFARDTVVVHSMDRLARNLNDLRALVLDQKPKACGWSSSKSIGLHKGGLPHGQPDALRHGAFADFERPHQERQREGIALASTREPNSTAVTATSHGSTVMILLLRLGTLESLRWLARQWTKGKIDPAPRIRCVGFVTVASPSEWPSKR